MNKIERNAVLKIFHCIERSNQEDRALEHPASPLRLRCQNIETDSDLRAAMREFEELPIDEEYDFKDGVRGKYAERYDITALREWMNLVHAALVGLGIGENTLRHAGRIKYSTK